MILVDDRAGSSSMVTSLHQIGETAVHIRLSAGDVAFLGRGPDQSILSIGIELKTIGDVLSCMANGRFVSKQLPHLIGEYDRYWLVMEGKYATDRDGLLRIYRHGHLVPVERNGRWLRTADLLAWLFSMNEDGGVGIWHSNNRAETAVWTAALYHRWSDKAYEDHHATRAFYQSQPSRGHSLIASTFSTRKDVATLPRRIAKEFPAIGWERSEAITQATALSPRPGTLPSAADLVNATVADLAAVVVRTPAGKPRKLGKKTAESIVSALHERRMTP